MQRTAWGLASLGISQSALSLIARRYHSALAAPSARKIALLVGVNQYPENVCDCPLSRGSALQGAVTDVELQRELLIHRFGFQASDVITVTDAQATRDGIESAFMSHLVGQVRPGDVAVFHFSGFGSQIRFASSGEAGGRTPVRNSLVPIDGTLPTPGDPTVNDLMESTLVLMLRSLQTRQITTVLDLSHAEPGTTLLGGIRIRSRPSVPSGDLNPKELAFQEQLSARLGIGSRPDRQPLSQAPGLILAATDKNRFAAEGYWNGFSAGLFTYALTQQLWYTTQATSIYVDMSQAAGRVEQIVGRLQQPVLLSRAKPSAIKPLMSSYPTVPTQPSADGVVSAIESDGQVSLWLGGLPALVLANYNPGSLMAVVKASDGQLSDRVWLQIKSREGLTAKAKPFTRTQAIAQAEPAQSGQIIQERLRVIPKNTPLIVALDFSLERIERVDATSALAAIPRISSVVAGEQPADYIFGKAVSPVQTTALSLDASSGKVAIQGGNVSNRAYGLFSLGRTAIPSTVLDTEEAVKTAVNRVAPQLRSLQAAKLLRLTENEASARLGVRATLEIVSPEERVVMQHTAQRSPWTAPESRLVSLLTGQGTVPSIPSGSKIQYRLQNFSDRPVYCVLLGVDSDGNAIALYPSTAQRNRDSGQDASLVGPGETIAVPPPAASAEWRIDSPPGLAETHVVFSATPLTKTAAAFDETVRPTGNIRQVSSLSDPLAIAQAILSDLHRASADKRVAGLEISSDAYALHVDQWATLSFYYRVDEAAS